MAKNFISDCNCINSVAPAGGVIGGTIVLFGSIVGVAESDAVEGDVFALNTEGAYSDLEKTAGEAWVKGDKLYFDPATGALTKVAGALEWAGYAYEAAAADAVVGSLLLKL